MNKCIHELFEEQVSQVPNNIAVVYEGQELTYQQLNEKSNQLAHYLRSLGVGPDTLVAIAVERSIEMIVGILGILKAGGAYVPLDPSYPKKRLQFMLRDTNAPILIIDGRVRDKCHELISDYKGTVIIFDEMNEIDRLMRQSLNNPISLSNPFNLSYVIYTSGSTGKPKGVMIQHISVLNLLNSFKFKKHSMGNNNNSLWTSISFDVSVYEIWNALIKGDSLHIISENIRFEDYKVFAYLEKHQINSSYLPPLWLKEFSIWLENNPKTLALTTLLVGVEPINNKVLYTINNKIPQLKIINGYGPTESTICATLYRFYSENDEAISLQTVPIGRPVLNTHIYILDNYMNPVPVGVAGEIYIGGIGLARGYLNRPDLTAEKFIPNPFLNKKIFLQEEKNKKDIYLRLYRTGDMGRYLSDGNIEFLGRLDNQLKIRGNRVELGEIESTLQKHKWVQQSVVVAREDSSGYKYLVAYFIPSKSLFSSKKLQTFREETVSHWQNVYEETYKDLSSTAQEFTGWISNYTRELIPNEEMQEWIENVIERLHFFKPKKVLEIGCGSGLILSQLASYCEEYVATDFSKYALQYLEMFKKNNHLDNLTLLLKNANDFSGIRKKHFDLVILNSVVQYFPDEKYLLQVLENAIDCVAPGGFIFIGDVRNFTLNEAYYASLEIHQTSDKIKRDKLLKQIKQGIENEKELLISPDFFNSFLANGKNLVKNVKIWLKRGKYLNEISRFRYDAVLHINDKPLVKHEVYWLDWHDNKISLSNITQYLTQHNSKAIGFKRIPNARLSTENTVLKSIRSLDGAAENPQKSLSLFAVKTSGIDPEDLFQIAKSFSYYAEVSWSNNYFDGSYDFIFYKSSDFSISMEFFSFCKMKFDPTILKEDTFSERFRKKYVLEKGVPQLKQFLKNRLPDYMIPASFVYVNDFPLTLNGKIDRKALPAPDLSLRMVETQYVAPITPLEQELCAIWADVLKVETIGIHDDFFKLGGHSLLATQVISRIRHNYNIEIPLKELFRSPTISALARTIDVLRKEKVNSSLLSIFAVERKEHSPLSFAQQRLWFLDQLLPEVALYNMPLAMRLKGTINLSALKVALDVLIKRHESLRTIFAVEEGAAYQTILPNISIDLKANTVDLSSLSPEEQSEKLRIYGQQEANTLFDLSLGPLIRVKLIILNKEEHVLLITLHHIISDGWSMGVFFKEFSILYNGYCIGEEVPGTLLAPLPIQYADFALWQREWLQGERLEQQLAYWKEKLSGVPDVLQLPTDRRRPKELSYNGNVYHCNLSRETREQLNNLSQRYQTSLFMTLLAVFQVLLYRYTRQEDIVVGSPIANRHYKEIEGLIGFFVNTLALRTKFTGEETFIDILHSVKETTLQAYQHQDVPFEQLVEHLNISRELNRNPLFQVMFALQNAGEEESLHLNNIQVEWLDSDYLVAKFDLRVSANEHEEGIELYFEYATDLFNLETIERFANHFKELVWAISKEPSQLILTYPLLTEREQQQLLIEWNDTTTEYSQDRDKCIHELFEEQVSRAPNNIAVVYEGQELTYQELNEKSNQLAHYLRSLGVGPDTLVAIAVERSIEMIVGILGILKAGGAYVPLDPSYPKERLQFILEDTSVPIILTNTKIIDSIPSIFARIICLDDDELPDNFDNLPRGSHNSYLAYVSYTSGSTGKPKGVMIPHRSLVNYTGVILKKLTMDYPLRFAYISTFSADLGNTCLYPALLSGSELHILEEKYAFDSNLLSCYFTKYKIDVLKIVPSHLNLLLIESEITEILPRRYLFLGGENFKKDISENIKNYTFLPEIFNHYGPTETTVGCCVFKVERDNHLDLDSVPIGRPISNTQIYILDDYMNPVPIGVSGEIYIGGEGLARGYLNRFELTADRFVPNPFVEAEDYEKSKNLRLYRSGDLARYLPDGNIEFLGRIDDQVKIRGFRIELGEIEAVLDSHGKVSRSIVLAREEELEHKYLVVYVRPQDEVIAMLQPLATLESASDQSFSVLSGEYLPSLTEDLRNYLGKSVPDYMIPASFVYVNDFPLTLNGKIDRKALPAPDLSLRMVETQYVAPITPLEQELCAIWADVLKVETIGIHDDFFKLGGHSLLAVQLVSRMYKEKIENASVTDIFRHPTVYLLSHHINTKLKDSFISPLFPIRIDGKNRKLFLIHPGGGLAHCYKGLEKYCDNLQIYGINNINFEDKTKSIDTIEEMAEFYIRLIKREHEGPYSLGGWSFGGLVAYEMARQFVINGEKVDNVLLIDTITPSNILMYQQQSQEHQGGFKFRSNPQVEYGLNEFSDFYEILHHNIEQCEAKIKRYKIKKYDHNVVLLRGIPKDTEVKFLYSDDYGWKSLAKKLKIFDIPGEHQKLFDVEYIKSTAECIKNCLADVEKILL